MWNRKPNTKPLKQRSEEFKHIIEKYPDRIPVIINCNENTVKELDLMKFKYLVPTDLTIGQFLFVIKKQCKLKESDGLYLFIKNSIMPVCSILKDIYKKEKNEDGFLYMTLEKENTFGNC